MLPFLWTILNIGLFIYFIFICYKATILVRGSLGLFAAVVFVIGVLALNCNAGRNNNTFTQIHTWPVNNDSGITNRSIKSDITIEETFLHSINLNVTYGYPPHSKVPVPVQVNAGISGTLIGRDWEAQHITLYPTGQPARYKYMVNGLTNWKLFNTVVSSQGKTYTGFFDLK